MRKVVTRLRFLSQDRGLYRPLIPGASSSVYSTMSHTTAGASLGHPAQESVHPAVRKDEEDTDHSPAALPLISDEPIVTRKELWSYYCIFSSLSPRGSPSLTSCCYQCTTMETTCVDLFVLLPGWPLRIRDVWMEYRELVLCVRLDGIFRVADVALIPTRQRLLLNALSVPRNRCRL
jgi:hypothetical protein